MGRFFSVDSEEKNAEERGFGKNLSKVNSDLENGFLLDIYFFNWIYFGLEISSYGERT